MAMRTGPVSRPSARASRPATSASRPSRLSASRVSSARVDALSRCWPPGPLDRLADHWAWRSRWAVIASRSIVTWFQPECRRYPRRAGTGSPARARSRSALPWRRRGLQDALRPGHQSVQPPHLVVLQPVSIARVEPQRLRFGSPRVQVARAAVWQDRIRRAVQHQQRPRRQPANGSSAGGLGAGGGHRRHAGALNAGPDDHGATKGPAEQHDALDAVFLEEVDAGQHVLRAGLEAMGPLVVQAEPRDAGRLQTG